MLSPAKSERRYSKVAIALHWAIAALIILNLSIGWFMEDLAEPGRTIVVRIHQSSGMTILLLSVARIVWRVSHRPPPLDRRMSRWERSTASIVHVLLYIGMLAIPLSGWALISANPPRFYPGYSPRPKYIMLWGAVPLYPITSLQAISNEPDGVVRQHALHQRIVRAHTLAGYSLLALLVLHVLGALKHQLLDRHDQLWRMGLGKRRITS